MSRRGLITAASVGITGPLLLDQAATAAGRAVIATKKVPVGGGVIVTARDVVVTQPRKGRFRVFTSVCTHEGCTVTDVAEQRISCPCHGSQFSITDGSVVAGPAPTPLPQQSFKVKRGKIYLT